MNNRLPIVGLLLGFACGLSLPAHAANLVGHWGFEEGSGNVALDSSTHHLNGSIVNGSYVAGKVGDYAMNFNGSSSYVEIGYNGLLNPDSVGISLWFKARPGQQTWADMLDKGHGYGTSPYYGGYVIQYEGNASSFYSGYGNGSNFYGAPSPAGFKDDQWHHLVTNLGADEISMYIDGQLISSAAGAGPITDNNSSLYFGRHRVLGRYFNGLLDDIQIFDGALSTAQVRALYQPPANNVPEPSMVTLVALGMLGIAGSLRRRRAANGVRVA